MKRIILICILLLVGCSLTYPPSRKVEEYLNNYRNLDENVVEDLNLSAEAEGLSVKNTEIYKEMLKRQYKDMKYTVQKENINDKEATVTMKITVYNLYQVSKETNEYLNTHQDEFMTDNVYDQEAFFTYKLNQMKKTTKTVDYNVEFYLVKVDGEWIIQEPEATVKEKIHGLYDYED